MVVSFGVALQIYFFFVVFLSSKRAAYLLSVGMAGTASRSRSDLDVVRFVATQHGEGHVSSEAGAALRS